jgi:hypothetical protein
MTRIVTRLLVPLLFGFVVPIPPQTWLHQTVIVVLAFSVVGTFALYEIVRRMDSLRFLFGMRATPRAKEPRGGRRTLAIQGWPARCPTFPLPARASRRYSAAAEPRRPCDESQSSVREGT